MSIHKIKSGSLALLSGVPGSGKSSLAARSNLPKGVVLSTDAMRELLVGQTSHFDESQSLRINPSATLDAVVWDTLNAVVTARLAQGLTTIVDAMFLADSAPNGGYDRNHFARLAKRFNVPFTVFIMNTPREVALERNRNRLCMVPESVTPEFKDSQTDVDFNFKQRVFDLSSAHPFVRVGDDDSIAISPKTRLEGSNWDVIGDVHGLQDQLEELLEKLGYDVSDGSATHPEGRKLLFLGDLVDRGPKSIETLTFVKTLCDQGKAIALKGNHEKKLLQFWDAAQAGNLNSWSSYSNAQTGVELLSMPRRKSFPLVDFMRNMPTYAIYEDESSVALFAHADLKSFNLADTSESELLHGCSKRGQFDSDASMQQYLESFDLMSTTQQPATKNQYFVRGHIPGTSWQPDVISLEAKGVQNGALLALRLDLLLERKLAIVPMPTNFDHNQAQAARVYDYKALRALVRQKLVTEKIDSSNGLRLFKYASSVFYKGSWSQNPFLEKARGHVYDIAGNLVSNPFDKVFNYLEQNAGSNLTDDTPVLAVEKLNGFLGVVSPHPYLVKDVLVHTTGTFDSIFAERIRSFITPSLRADLLKLFNEQKLTLTFEVLHQDDPHVIPYTESEMGLVLIGVREIANNAPLWTQSKIDALGKQLGLRTANSFETTFGQLKEVLIDCRHEGFMVRQVDGNQETVCKLKSPYYLTTKFLGRMGAGNWKHLFSNPESFKSKIDEEFFTLVDVLVDRYNAEHIQHLDELEKMTLIRSLITTL